MRSEYDVAYDWRSVFKGGNLSEKTFKRAQQLIDALSVESPLRIRFENELNELRKIGNDRKRKHKQVSAAGRDMQIGYNHGPGPTSKPSSITTSNCVADSMSLPPATIISHPKPTASTPN